MSGIAGMCSLRGGPIDESLLEAMLEQLEHRGPDGAGRWIGGSAALGHRSLHTTPESQLEDQPLLDETGLLCLTLDGRVDNRAELRASLLSNGAFLRDETDAELVLKAYRVWGADCPAKIVGDFAFAIWDERRQLLFCARDPLGIKPFYYAVTGDTFLFASEMQPLFEWPELTRKPNLPLIGLYLLGNFDEREETLYEGIRRLPAAHALTLRGQDPRIRRYWDVDPSRVIRYRTDHEYAEHFLSLFREAVAAQLRSAGPVAAFLSGGLDSSSVVSTAQSLYRSETVPMNDFSTFSIVFDEFRCDERAYIWEVIRKWDLASKFVVYDELDPCVFGFEQMTSFPDVLYEPVGLMHGPALEEMRQRGIRVLLDGLGGDELMAAGFGHLTDLLRAREFGALIRQLRFDSIVYSVSPLSLVRYCLRPLLPTFIKAAFRPLSSRLPRDGTRRLVKPEFVRNYGLSERLSTYTPRVEFPTRAQQVIYDGLFYGWNATVCLDMSNLYTNRFSLEARHPFFHRRLVEFALALPEDQRWRADEPKFVLRQAMCGILPEKIRSRRGKAEFSRPIDRELKERQAESVERIFSTSVLADLGVVDRIELGKLFEEYHGGSRHYLTGAVELVLELELWCRAANNHAGQRDADMDKPVMRTDDLPAQERKEYTSPRLVEYGDVRKLTQTGGSTHPDGMGGVKKIGL